MMKEPLYGRTAMCKHRKQTNPVAEVVELIVALPVLAASALIDALFNN